MNKRIIELELIRSDDLLIHIANNNDKKWDAIISVLDCEEGDFKILDRFRSRCRSHMYICRQNIKIGWCVARIMGLAAVTYPLSEDNKVSVLIHCRDGLSLCCDVAVSYMRACGYTTTEATKQVLDVEPSALLNPEFMDIHNSTHTVWTEKHMD